MREHAGSSLVLSLLIVAGFAILLFPDEKGLKATASRANATATQTAARATPASPLPVPSDSPPTLPAPRPSLARSIPQPPDAVRHATVVEDAPAVVPTRRSIAEADPIQPRATFTAASRVVTPSINEDDVPQLEPVDLAEMRPEPVRRRVGGSWQAGPAQRGR